MSRKFLITTVFTVFVAAVVFLLAPRTGPRTKEAMPHDAYVWQRAWTEDVRDAIVAHGSNFTQLIALSAEVTWHQRQPQVTRVAVDPEVFRSLGRSVGLALRIGSYPGPFNAGDAQARFLTELAVSLASEAATKGLPVSELQIDFDCAESKLDGYAVWVEAIRRKLTPVRVTITALPVWLKHSGFRRLIAVTDGYVLQVHSLERPKGAVAAFQLCDPESARHAVEVAGRLGKPFRVALPTYGYLTAFDPAGRFIGISAEGPLLSWPEGTQLREVRADPQVLAQLVQRWTLDRPRTLTGVLWYRLPIADERLNWRWPTLASVMAGQTPHSDVQAEVRHASQALVEVDLVNAGAAEFSQPVQVTLRWQEGRLIAADGLQGFDSAEAGPKAVQFQSRNGLAHLGPGERRNIGWVRLDKETQVQIELGKSLNR